MTRRLRVGVPGALRRLPAHTSVARIWSQALPRLDRRFRLVEDGAPAWRGRRSVDVWLTDGHQGPMAVDQPVVAHFHEAAWHHPELEHLYDPAFLARYAAPSAEAARRATRLLTVSETSKDQLVDAYGISPDLVRVAHNGVDLALHRPGVAGGAELVSTHGGDGGRPYVLFVGTLHPRKNLGVLREAMEDLAADHPHALVLVAGPAPDRPDSAALATAAVAPIAGRAVVNLAGLSDGDLAAVLAGASLLCLPSLMEGFGMPVVEAMACGTPVVVADRGALPEVVGDAGVVVQPHAAAVARGLRCVLDDPVRAAELAALGLRRARRFTWDAMVEVWAGALLEAAEQGS